MPIRKVCNISQGSQASSFFIAAPAAAADDAEKDENANPCAASNNGIGNSWVVAVIIIRSIAYWEAIWVAESTF